ncbi:DUF4354 family protein [Serratia sp. IR-2025]
MKVFVIIASLTLAGFCLAANASTLGDVAVYATEQSQGSISMGGKTAYTKTFEVSIVALSAGTVDLSKLCLKAYSPDEKEFRLDTVDEVLTSDALKEGKPVKGIVVFSSENDAVHNAALVKISEDCK